MKFKEGKIISRLFIEKNGKQMEIVIRAPKRSDVKAAWRFYNKVIRETEFLSRITPVSMKDEKKWLSDTIIKLKKKNAVFLFAEHNGKIVGSCDVHLQPFSESDRHVGTYGIAILQEYTDIGLGSKMSRCLFSIAEKELKTEIIQLSVYSNNKIAQRVYKKLGFRYAGKIPKGIKHRSGYQDNIIMYKALK